MKKLCKFKKANYKKNKKFILLHINDPKFICKKCLRVSDEKEFLCKSEKI